MKLSHSIISAAESKQEQLREPLLSLDDVENPKEESVQNVVDDDKKEDNRPPANPNFSFPFHIFGLGIGMAASAIALNEADKLGADISRASLVFLSVVYSTATSIIAFVSFTMLWRYLLRTYKNTPAMMDHLNNINTISNIETAFAIGVFFGFCGSCVVNDFLRGFPMLFVGLTFVGSLGWGLFMYYCGTFPYPTKQVKEDRVMVLV